MRKQYHFRPSPSGFFAWDVDRLVRLSRDLPVQELPFSAIGEIDKNYWFDHGEEPTGRKLVEHFKLLQEVDLSFPILLCAEGRLMDWMHRVLRALLEAKSTITARQFLTTPEPDFVDVHPDDLPY